MQIDKKGRPMFCKALMPIISSGINRDFYFCQNDCLKRFHILVVPDYKIFPIDSGGAHHQLVYLARQQHQHSIEMVVTPKNLSKEYFDDFTKQFPAIKLIP